MNNGKILKYLITEKAKLLQRTLQTGVRKLSISSALSKNHYDVLGVKRDATQAEIKNAYFELSKIYHPDRIAGTDENISKFREITTAYEVLGNEQSRRFYDNGLMGERAAGIDQPEVIDDPIVKFYRHRYEYSKSSVLKDEFSSFVPPSQFKPLTRSEKKTNELFPERKAVEVEVHNPLEYLYFLFFTTILFYLLVAPNVKNSCLEKLLRRF